MNLQEKLLLAVDRLGIDHETEEHLLSIAQDLVASELPDGWEEAETTDETTGQALVYYYNHNTDESQWDHPCLDDFLAKVEDGRSRSKSVEEARSPAKPKSSDAPHVQIVDLGEVEGPIPEGTCDVLEPVPAVRHDVRTDTGPLPTAANSSAVSEKVKEIVPSAISTPPDAVSDASDKYSQDDFSSESSADEGDILALFDDSPPPPVATPDEKNASNQRIGRLTSPDAVESAPVTTSTASTSAVGQRKSSIDAYYNLAETADQLRSMQMATSTTSSQGIHPNDIFQSASVPAKNIDEISLRNELADTKRAKNKAEFDLKVSLLHHSEQIEDMKRELDAVQDDANGRTQELHHKCAALEADKDAALSRVKVLENELEREHQKNAIRRSFLCDASVQAEECQYPKLADEKPIAPTNITTLEKENRILLEKVQTLQNQNAELLKTPEKLDDGTAIAKIVQAKKQVVEMRKQCRAILQTIE
mmetsp:Transcript_21088/g.45965  ORF Transcript_21088/g.45965 Transcript_21088/m.45965 type:complete len:477 (-) Transcript_21088:92-1522(-)